MEVPGKTSALILKGLEIIFVTGPYYKTCCIYNGSLKPQITLDGV